MYMEVGQVDRAPVVLPPVEGAVVPRGMMQVAHVANQIGPGGRAAKELARADLHRAPVLREEARESSGGIRPAHHGHQLAPGSRRQIVPGDERNHLMARVVPSARGPQVSPGPCHGRQARLRRRSARRTSTPSRCLGARSAPEAPRSDERYSCFGSTDESSADLGDGDTAAERRRALGRLHHAERQEPGLDVDRRRGPAGDGVEEQLELVAQRLLPACLDGFDGALVAPASRQRPSRAGWRGRAPRSCRSRRRAWPARRR